MEHRPILFSTPMVQAIIAGDKTQTRRIMKPQPVMDAQGGFKYEQNKKSKMSSTVDPAEAWMLPGFCPYGTPGDLLWVREGFCYVPIGLEFLLEGMDSRFVYKTSVHPDWMKVAKEHGLKWRPGIHMPKPLCRIFLEIVAVRVERLQNISEDDARAEGMKHIQVFSEYGITSQQKFSMLWSEMHGKQSWSENPFVWVIEFQRIEKPENWPA